MLELYIDRLIDLLAPASKEVSFKVLSTRTTERRLVQHTTVAQDFADKNY